MIRVVLAGDQDLIRGGLRAILDGEDDIQAVVAAYECGLVVPRG